MKTRDKILKEVVDRDFFPHKFDMRLRSKFMSVEMRRVYPDILRAIKEAKLEGYDLAQKEILEKIEKWFIDEGLIDSMGQIKLKELKQSLKGKEKEE